MAEKKFFSPWPAYALVNFFYGGKSRFVFIPLAIPEKLSIIRQFDGG